MIRREGYLVRGGLNRGWSDWREWDLIRGGSE